MTASLTHWLYASTSRIGPADDEAQVADIVTVARDVNQRLSITGSLIYTGKRFAQYLEGPGDGLDVVRAKIANDPRHSDIVTLSEGSAAERRFAGWTLAYRGGAAFVERCIVLALSPHANDDMGRERLLRLMAEFEHQDRSPIIRQGEW